MRLLYVPEMKGEPHFNALRFYMFRVFNCRVNIIKCKALCTNIQSECKIYFARDSIVQGKDARCESTASV